MLLFGRETLALAFSCPSVRWSWRLWWFRSVDFDLSVPYGHPALAVEFTPRHFGVTLVDDPFVVFEPHGESKPIPHIRPVRDLV